MLTVSVYLKSGQTINVECESYKFERSQMNDSFMSYEFSGIKNHKTVSFLLSQIAAYTAVDDMK